MSNCLFSKSGSATAPVNKPGWTKPWDPLDAWPTERRWIWATLALWPLIFHGPAFIENLRARPREKPVPDFFQDYASASNWLGGFPVYGDQHEAATRYLAVHLDNRRSLVVVNAHPPTSVLLALPLAGLDFTVAFLAWNLLSLGVLALSLWIVQQQLKIPLDFGSLAALLALLLLCFPLWEQCRLGQLTLVLLLLVTGAWAAERSGYPRLAGSLLGTATMIKLFPGFLLVYYALRGHWKVVAAGLLAVAASRRPDHHHVGYRGSRDLPRHRPPIDSMGSVSGGTTTPSGASGAGSWTLHRNILETGRSRSPCFTARPWRRHSPLSRRRRSRRSWPWTSVEGRGSWARGGRRLPRSLRWRLQI